MIVSYRWLTRVLGFEIALEPLLERLTMNGLEIESVNDAGLQSGKIVVGRILEMGPHPNAENLVLCRVDTGKAEPLQIVCGAKNMKPGDHVPVAIEGAKLPGGIVIKKSKIRGETSMGMMCSVRELGIGDDHEGLMILPQDQELYPIGAPFDALIDIKVTPNRPDCLSVFGIARDVAAAFGKPAPSFPPFELQESQTPVRELASLRIDAPQGCPRYAGRVIQGVTIAPSPLWLRRSVECAGMRSINNVVDVTNYILLELGHPLHAFDLDKVAGHTVVVRMARDGEEVTTLDEQTNKLTAADLLITDPEKPIALAGIMGCGNSEIDNNTRNVFLECAYFNPSTIRATSKRLAKSTDSSYRFERGTDWQNLPRVIDRAARLIVEVAGGTVACGMLDEACEIPAPAAIELNEERINGLLGLSMSRTRMVEILESLDFWTEIDDQGRVMVRPPAFRPDVSREADLAEEIARIHGFDNIPADLPRLTSQATEITAENRVVEALRTVLPRCGFLEAANYSFLGADALERVGFDAEAAPRLRNPLSADYAALRTSLVPGLLNTMLYNQNHGQLDARLFEVGKVFAAASDTNANGRDEQGKVAERMQYAAAVAGPAQNPTWRVKAKQADFYDAKAVAESILAEVGVEEFESVRLDKAGEIPGLPAGLFHPGKAAVLRAGDADSAYVGELHPALVAKLEFKRPVVLLFGDVAPLAARAAGTVRCREISQFPPVSRDLALVADREVTSAEIESVIAKRAKSLLKSIRLFDVYEGERIGENRKSLAYALTFGAGDRTLKDDEINPLIDKILADLKAKLNVELRA